MRPLAELVRPNIRTLAPYSTARDEYGGQRIDVWLDANESPYDNGVNRYPDPRQQRLREVLAARKGIAADRIFIGSGSDEAIDLAYRIFCRPGIDNAVSIAPTYGMYRVAAAVNDVELREVPLGDDFSLPVERLLAAADERSKLLWLCSPNNPTGNAFPAQEIESLLRRFDGIVVLDEAYMDFTDDEADYSLAKRLDEFPNVIISRTFSKSFGMAGLRLGYAIVPEELADHYWRVRLPFSVNLMAEEAGIAALQDVAFHDETVRVVREGRAWLTGELTKLGCRVFPSQSNFLMFELPADGPNAASLFEDLLRRGIILRPLTSYGLPRNLRVSVGTAEENTMLINAMRELL